MRESIKDRVAIVGMGCTRFGERWKSGIEDLIAEAVDEALQDAGVELKDIQAIWFGSFTGGHQSEAHGPTGIVVSSALQSQGIPVTRLENACASGQEAVRGAALGIASKCYDLVLAIGAEKMKDVGGGGLGAGMPGRVETVYGSFGTASGRYAMAATAYFSKYGLSEEEGKRILAEIDIKSHYYGARNPRSHLRREITVEDVLNAPTIA
jgi:acetyl-CoA C-acetyltransferase